MYKKLFGLFLLVTLTASGCSWGETFVDGPQYTSYEGVLTEQHDSDDYPGTHFLETNDGRMLLRSLKFDISTRQYLDNRVTVMGVLNEEDDVFEVTGISLAELLGEYSEIVKLVQYKNTDLGFQLEYYNDWKVKEEVDSVTFLAPSAEDTADIDKVIVSQEPYQHAPSVFDTEGDDTPLSSYFSKNLPEFTGYNDAMREIGPDGLDAILVEDSFGAMDYYVYRNGLIYTISFTPSAKNHIAVNESVFKEMVAGFRFVGFTVEDDEDEKKFDNEDGIDIDESLLSEEASFAPGPCQPLDYELTGFESLPFHFMGEYPKSWYYAGSHSGDSNVAHHYGFATDSVTDENTVISLDIYNGDLPEIKELCYEDDVCVRHTNENGHTIYRTVGVQNFRISGSSEYGDLMCHMIFGLSSTKEE